MNIESNKKIVVSFIETFSKKDYKILETLLHEEFSQLNFVLSKSNVKLGSHQNVNFFEFLSLFHFSPDTIEEGKKLIRYQNKSDLINYRKWLNKILVDPKIVVMIAEGDKVWASVDFAIQDPAELSLSINIGYFFLFKDGQIIGYVGAGRYLNAILAYGQITFKQDNSGETARYLQILQKMGILPESLEL